MCVLNNTKFIKLITSITYNFVSDFKLGIGVFGYRVYREDTSQAEVRGEYTLPQRVAFRGT